MKNFKKCALLIVIIIAIQVILIDYVVASGNNSLSKGSKAIQFQLFKTNKSMNSTSILSNFLGTSISGIYHISNSSAIRAGLSVYCFEEDNEYLHWGDYSSEEAVVNGDVMLQISAQYIRFYNISNKTTFYIGGGPNLSMEIIDEKTNRSNDNYTSVYYEENYNSDYWRVGLTGVVGAYYSITGWLGIHGEYCSIIAYRWNVIDTKYDYTNFPDGNDYSNCRHSWYLKSLPVRFGVSIYF